MSLVECVLLRDYAEIQKLWEESQLSARDIGDQFGLSKNAVIGMADRRGWKKRLPGRSGANNRKHANQHKPHESYPVISSDVSPLFPDSDKACAVDTQIEPEVKPYNNMSAHSSPVIRRRAPQLRRPKALPPIYSCTGTPEYINENRRKELSEIEKYIEEKGVVVVPGFGDPAIEALPPLRWDYYLKKQTRRPE